MVPEGGVFREKFARDFWKPVPVSRFTIKTKGVSFGVGMLFFLCFLNFCCGGCRVFPGIFLGHQVMENVHETFHKNIRCRWTQSIDVC